MLRAPTGSTCALRCAPRSAVTPALSIIQLDCTGPFPHLTPTLSAPRGREGAHAVSDSGPAPPFKGEGTGEVGGWPSRERIAVTYSAALAIGGLFSAAIRSFSIVRVAIEGASVLMSTNGVSGVVLIIRCCASRTTLSSRNTWVNWFL